MTGHRTDPDTDAPEDRKVQLRKEDERRWRKVFRILYTLVAATAIVGGWTYYLSTQDSKQNKIDKERTVELQKITRGLAQTVRDIQQSRIDITRDQCKAQNRRNTRTIRRLKQVIRKAEREATDPVRRAQIRASAGSSILLIGELQPKQDCEALIEKRFG
jgi:Na+/phosphate symporter